MTPRTNNDMRERRMPTCNERKALEKFARFEISLEDLQRELGGMLEIDFGKEERKLTSYFLLAQPGIRVEKEYIQNAMDKHARGEISIAELADWGSVLLLLDAYDWQGPEEEEIAEWLNEIGMLVVNPEDEVE